ncbi:MAG: YdeI family protein [Candidatus Aminicenantia bacterium]
MKQLYVKTRDEWKNWLSKHHNRETEVWLIFFKKETRKPSIEYGAAVEEALCFGWIDSIIKKIDDTKYARKFTPRKDNSKWSELNKKRTEKMIREGRMTEFGLVKIDAAKKAGYWDKLESPDISFDLPLEFEQALAQNKKANENFKKLAPTYQKQYIGWIAVAKRQETKERRIKESIVLLQKGEKLGLR